MRCGRGVELGVGVLLVLVWGCSTARVVYPGGRRSRGEVATIHFKDTVLEEIDGVPVRALAFEAFEVLPGPHALRVRLEVTSPVAFTPGRYYSEGGLFVCFMARPGHAYTVIPAFEGGDLWKPEMVDQATTYRISVRYAMPGTSECRGERPKPPDVPAAPPATELADEPSVPAPAEEQGRHHRPAYPQHHRAGLPRRSAVPVRRQRAWEWRWASSLVGTISCWRSARTATRKS